MPGTPRKATKATPAKAAPVRMAGHQAKKTTAPARRNAGSTGGYTLGQRGQEALFDLNLPSGETCQVRRPGVQGLISAGVLDSFDQLTSFVQTNHIDPHRPGGKVSEQTKEAAQDMAKDPAKMAAGFQLIDKLVAFVVNQPRVWIDYQMLGESAEEFARRQSVAGEAIAVRDVDLGDKLFIVQWAVGGSADLNAFRLQLGDALANLAAIESLQEPAQ